MTHSTVGDGPRCPEPGDHGKTYTTARGHLWCPVSQTLFEGDGLTVGTVIRQGDHVVDLAGFLEQQGLRLGEGTLVVDTNTPVDLGRDIRHAPVDREAEFDALAKALEESFA